MQVILFLISVWAPPPPPPPPFPPPPIGSTRSTRNTAPNIQMLP